MRIVNHTRMPEVESFLRIYGSVLEKKFGHESYDVTILPLPDEDNPYNDILVRLGKRVFISATQIGKVGFTIPELFAAIAHELGHIFYHTAPWDVDAENRADSLAAEIGLGSQMIQVIEKIIQSRRYRNMTSLLVQRIQFLKHLA